MERRNYRDAGASHGAKNASHGIRVEYAGLSRIPEVQGYDSDVEPNSNHHFYGHFCVFRFA